MHPNAVSTPLRGSRRASRREVLKAAAAVALAHGVAAAQTPDTLAEPVEADLEAVSNGKTIRIGSPATGAVVTLPLEVYVARVLAAEADPRAADASREALGIAIRTYTLFNEARHARDGYDLCDTTHCQVLRNSSGATRRLTLASVGQILLYEGRPASLFYSASCGGFTERASDVWPGVSYPYLQARADDVHTDDRPWTLDLPFGDVEEALARLGYRGTLRSAEVERRTASGRAGSVRLNGLEPTTIGGDAFRLALGSTRVRSTAFSMVSDDEGLHFIGRGYGHGVGMCVVGANRRAQRGESAAQILAQYYPGLQLARPTVSQNGTSSAPRPQPFPQPR